MEMSECFWTSIANLYYATSREIRDLKRLLTLDFVTFLLEPAISCLYQAFAHYLCVLCEMRPWGRLKSLPQICSSDFFLYFSIDVSLWVCWLTSPCHDFGTFKTTSSLQHIWFAALICALRQWSLLVCKISSTFVRVTSVTIDSWTYDEISLYNDCSQIRFLRKSFQLSTALWLQ